MYETIDPDENVYQEESDLEQYSWYFGSISRTHAESLLDAENKRHGNFLIRDAIPQTDPPEYRISILELMNSRWMVRHYKIKRSKNSFYIDNKDLFPSLNTLICQYSKHRSVLPVLLHATAEKKCNQTTRNFKSTSSRSEDYENCNVENYVLYPHQYENMNDGEEISPKPADAQTLFRINDNQITKTSLISSRSTKNVELWKGSLCTVEEPVAIKIMKSSSSEEEQRRLLDEANALIALQHENVIQLLGFVQSNPSSIVTSYESNGDLASLFFSDQPHDNSLAALLRMAKDVARGLNHISTLHFVHRNVCLSNVLVGHDFACKLGGFSNAIQLNSDGNYFSTEDDPAIDLSRHRYMALENFTEKRFSTFSDVWSFSIFLHELFTRGERPYSAILTNRLSTDIQAGKRLKKSPQIPNEIYELMQKCWNDIDSNRPTFQFLLESMDKMKFSDAQVFSQKIKRVKTSPIFSKRYSKAPNLRKISRNLSTK